MNTGTEFVRETVDEIVVTQLREDMPPEARQTVERLMASGYLRQEALVLLGCALAREMFEVLGSGEGFDERRYVASLERLPALPWD